MNEKKPSAGKRHARAFVPRLTLKRAAVAVVPLCAVGVLTACSGDDDDSSFSVAAIGFDAGVDARSDATVVVIALAVAAFDAAVDGTTTDAADAAHATDASDAADATDATDAADAADGAD